MAGGKRRLKQKPSDPGRQRRINEMREGEQRLRASLDRTLKLGKELADRLHYDKLSDQVKERFEPLPARLKDLITKRADVLGACFLANYQLERECESLQRGLERRAGRPAAPTLQEQIGPIVGGLSKKHAGALMLIAALHDAPPATAPEDTSAHTNAGTWLAEFDRALSDFERESTLLIEIAHERVRRGWADETAVRQIEAQYAASLAPLKSHLVSCRDHLASWRATYERLRERRAELRQKLDASP